jgi:hypothetical protein
MKRFSLLLPAMLMILMLPARTQAAPSEVCKQIKNIQPVSSHYTKRVLDRADVGLANAAAAPVTTDFDRYRASWARDMGAAWAALVDSQQTLTGENASLTQDTACLQLDLLLIECKMDDVRTAMNEQLERGSIVALDKLKALLQFLNERHRHLKTGALDPLHQDTAWNGRFSFDPPESWCCPEGVPGNTCKEVSEATCVSDGGQTFDSLLECTAWGCVPGQKVEVLCPFNADYAAPFQSGFGCDIGVMTPRAGYGPLQAELEALTVITRQIDDYRRLAKEMQNMQSQSDEVFGNESGTPNQQERDHVKAYGCGTAGGVCSGDATVQCMSDSDCKDKGKCEPMKKVCEGNRVIRCENDDQCGSVGPCSDEAQLPSLRTLRGSFSVDKDQLAILSQFLGIRSAQEISREYSDELKLASEFKADQTVQRDQRELEQGSMLLQLGRNAMRATTRIWSRIQGQQEAAIFPQAVDAQLEIADALKTLHSSVSQLAKLASQKTGVRQFVARYAYFIRRTCTYRPCNLMLDQVIKIVLSDDCFPYTNGDYLNDDPNNPRWQKCKTDADL